MGLEKLQENERSALLQFKAELTKKFCLVEFILYGSKARGDNAEDSDIDVMIVVDKRTPKIESAIYDIAFEINLRYDTFISVLLFDEQELTEGPMSESPIVKSIRREGIPA